MARKPRTKRCRKRTEIDNKVVESCVVDDAVQTTLLHETSCEQVLPEKRGKLSCDHAEVAKHRSIFNLLESLAKATCSGCDGRAKWVCLRCKTPLCAKGQDHLSSHFEETGHPHYAYLKTGRILCQICEDEITLDAENGPASEPSCASEEKEPESVGRESMAVTVRDARPVFLSRAETRGRPLEPYAVQSRPIHINLEDEDDDIRPRGLSGLYNLGNTCYANAALQALVNCPPFSDFFRIKTNLRPFAATQPHISNAFAQLVQNMWSARRTPVIHPGNLLNKVREQCPQFSGFSQQDSQEFIRCLLELLHRELGRPVYAHEENINRSEGGEGPERRRERERRRRVAEGSTQRSSQSSSSAEEEAAAGDSGWSSDGDTAVSVEEEVDWKSVGKRSIVSDAFDGSMESAVRCLTCGNVSKTTEAFEDLSLQIASPPQQSPPNLEEDEEMDEESWWSGWLSWLSSLSSWMETRSVSLEDCFAAFFTPDRLIGDDMYSCQKCSKLRNGVKSYRITKMPEILCVHLKRFHHDHTTASKVNTRVTFPLVGLDLSEYAAESAGISEYELTSLVCHEGSSVDSGHYLAVARNEIDGNWYEFDDSTVTRLDAAYVLTKNAYVLFYQKKQGQEHDRTRLRIREMIHSSTVAAIRCADRNYVSTEWLERVSTFAEPGPISNFDFLCPHGNLLPRRVPEISSLCTSVSPQLWKFIVQTFGGGPAVSSLHYCAVCEKRARFLNDKRAAEKEGLGKVQIHLLTERQKDGSALFESHLPVYTCLLSRSWLHTWEKFIADASAEPPGPIDNSSLLLKNADGKCQVRPRSSCVPVAREIFVFFQNIYGGGPEVWQTSGEQPLAEEMSSYIREAEEMMTQIRKERARLAAAAAQAEEVPSD